MPQNLSRRSFLRTTALSSVGLALATRLKAQPASLSRKPNLIVFLPDQQRADTLACYGAPRTLAPNLDKLASQSFVFQQAYVTHPVCTPSRSALMTGVWPHVNRCTRNNVRLEPHFQCLPEMLADSDYRSAYMGKWHLGDEVFAQHGFDEWVSILDGHQASFSPGRDPNAVSDYNHFLVANGLTPTGKKNAFERKFESTLPLDLSKPKFLEAKACDFLERHRRDPFVLFVAFFEPHPPYNGPLNGEHPVDEIDLDPTSDHVFGEDMPLRYRMRQMWDQKKLGPTPEKRLRLKQHYSGLVTQIDQSMGAILAKLEQLGLADNTIVVHTSDHGDLMGAHRLIGKGVMFQEAVRVPWLVRMPNQRQTIALPQSVSQIDFIPTMADLLGKTPSPQCAGRSLAPLLRGESMPAETIFMEWSPGRERKIPRRWSFAARDDLARAMHESTRAAIFPDGWKLCLRDTDKNELYNLRFDPREEHNLYGSVHKDVITRLAGEIHRWQEGVGDTVKV